MPTGNRAFATELHHGTIEETVPAVIVTLPTAVPPTETITLPGNIVGWYEAPIYARVTGYEHIVQEIRCLFPSRIEP